MHIENKYYCITMKSDNFNTSNRLILSDFSLVKWLEDQGSNSAVSVLPKDIVNKLLDDLHISNFLSLGSCTASSPAWKSG
jgi:hypothetical protein